MALVKVISLMALVGLCFASPARNSPASLNVPPPALEQTEIHDDSGQYSHSYQTADGSSFTEQGTLQRSSDSQSGNVLVKRGSYSFITPEGMQYTVSYVADELGFQPTGSHIFPI